MLCKNNSTILIIWYSVQYSISFPENARSQVKGGHSSVEIELIHVEFLTWVLSMLSNCCKILIKYLEFLVENLILFTLKSDWKQLKMMRKYVRKLRIDRDTTTGRTSTFRGKALRLVTCTVSVYIHRTSPLLINLLKNEYYIFLCFKIYI